MQRDFKIYEKIAVFGLGNLAGNTINKIIDRRENIDFAIADDNKEVLDSCKAPLKIFPNEVHDFKKFFDDNFHETDMIFIIDILGEYKDFALRLAYAAKDTGALTLGIPIQNKELDETDLRRFERYSDSVILSCVNDKEILDVPAMIIEGIINLITEQGFVNIDFYDIRSIFENAGTSFFGAGYAEGQRKSEIAAQKVLDMCGNITKAKNILLNMTTACDTSSKEINSAAVYFENLTEPDTQVIWGHTVDDSMINSIKIIMLISMNDNGYVSYYDMFKHGSYENLSSFVKNGITHLMKFRLGSERNFFVNGLRYGSPKIVKLFVVCGYDPRNLENNGIFPNKILADIISRDDAVEILKILFDCGITLSDNLVHPILEAKTPEIYKIFVNYGWDVNSCTNDKLTVLAHAVARFPVEYVKALIELGAEIDSRDKEGRTPLMRLISNFQFFHTTSPDPLQKLKILLDNGANLFAVDNKGRNALGKSL